MLRLAFQRRTLVPFLEPLGGSSCSFGCIIGETSLSFPFVLFDTFSCFDRLLSEWLSDPSKCIVGAIKNVRRVVLSLALDVVDRQCSLLLLRSDLAAFLFLKYLMAIMVDGGNSVLLCVCDDNVVVRTFV